MDVYSHRDIRGLRKDCLRRDSALLHGLSRGKEPLGQRRIPFENFQKMAKMFGGLATPPSTWQGSLVTKKLHLFSARHFSANFSRWNSSPMGQPHPANNTSCSDQSFCVGQHSRAG